MCACCSVLLQWMFESVLLVILRDWKASLTFLVSKIQFLFFFLALHLSVLSTWIYLSIHIWLNLITLGSVILGISFYLNFFELPWIDYGVTCYWWQINAFLGLHVSTSITWTTFVIQEYFNLNVTVLGFWIFIDLSSLKWKALHTFLVKKMASFTFHNFNQLIYDVL